MSDMLDAVLRMPIELWSDSHLNQLQRHGRYVEAANLIQKLTAERDALQAKLDSGVRVYAHSLPFLKGSGKHYVGAEENHPSHLHNATLILD